MFQEKIKALDKEPGVSGSHYEPSGCPRRGEQRIAPDIDVKVSEFVADGKVRPH